MTLAIETDKSPHEFIKNTSPILLLQLNYI